MRRPGRRKTPGERRFRDEGRENREFACRSPPTDLKARAKSPTVAGGDVSTKRLADTYKAAAPPAKEQDIQFGSTAARSSPAQGRQVQRSASRDQSRGRSKSAVRLLNSNIKGAAFDYAGRGQLLRHIQTGGMGRGYEGRSLMRRAFPKKSHGSVARERFSSRTTGGAPEFASATWASTVVGRRSFPPGQSVEKKKPMSPRIQGQ